MMSTWVALRQLTVDAARRIRALWPQASPPDGTQPLPIRTHLWRLIVTVLLPLLALGLYFALSLANAERSVTEARRADVANSLAFLVDRELAAIQGKLRALSLAPALIAGDFNAFRPQAEVTAGLAHIDSVVVTDPTGAVVFSTVARDRASIPTSSTGLIDVVYQGRSAVSGVTSGRVSGMPIVFVAVPVWRDGKVVYALTFGVRVDRFQALFGEAGLEASWTAAVVDRHGLFVTRNVDAERRRGQPARSEVVDAAQGTADAGRFENITHEGTATASFFRRSSLSGWIAVVAVPTVQLNAPYWRSLGLLAALGLAASLATLAAASAVARRISVPVVRIGEAANALAEGRPLPALPRTVSEVLEVGKGFERAQVLQAQRKRLDQLLAESEERQRLALEAGKFGTWDANPDTDEAVWSAEHFAMLGYPMPPRSSAPATIGMWLERLHPEDAAAVVAEIARARRAGDRFRSEHRIIRADTGEVRWLMADGQFRITSEGRPRFVGVARDITERKLQDDRLRLLMGEVNHRAKNLLSVVQAIARQTARSGDPQMFAARLNERLTGLAASQDLLLKTQWSGIAVEVLVRAQLGHFKDLLDRRILVDGPDVKLNAAAAQSIGMALHELATNAAKYGALSNERGSVEMTWHVDNTGSEPFFEMHWRERDGPAVVPPDRRGFGQAVMLSMVEMAVSGSASLDYASTGVIWRLRCPAKHALELVGRGSEDSR